MHGHGDATIDLQGSVVPPPRLQSKQGSNSKYVSRDGNDFSSTSSKVSSFSVPQTPRSEGEILQSSNLKSFSFAELKMSTRDFCPDSLLGEGSFGSVFKGWIDEHTFAAAKPGTGMIVAVKLLKRGSFHKEWLAEVNCLGQLSHPHVVKLIGYCREDRHRLLVYEFMPQGSLESHLYKRGSCTLSWNLRLKVALDAAKGLAFLHGGQSHQVIHRDFKTSNILLDSSYNAKLSDFRLARDGPTGNATHVSTTVVGTYAYLAPEYSTTGHLTAKSDVYSFGVFLLEMLSGRRAHDMSDPYDRVSGLLLWATPYLANKRKLFRILDHRIEGQYTIDGAYEAATLALRCLSRKAKSRPTMNEVVTELEQLQESEMNCSELGRGQLQESEMNCSELGRGQPNCSLKLLSKFQKIFK